METTRLEASRRNLVFTGIGGAAVAYGLSVVSLYLRRWLVIDTTVGGRPTAYMFGLVSYEFRQTRNGTAFFEIRNIREIESPELIAASYSIGRSS